MPDRIVNISGHSEHPHLRTRVDGLDRLLDGGLLAGDAYLVSGGPGTGKTTLGNQLAFQHAAAGDSAVIFMFQTEPHEWMLAHLGGFRFVRPELINKRIHYISLLRQIENEGLPAVLQSIQMAVREHHASMIVLDGAGYIDTAHQANSELSSAHGRFVRDLQARAAMLNCTCVLLSDRTSQPMLAQHVDGVIELDYEPVDSRDRRWVRVAKQRGARHLSGRHEFTIGQDGIVVYPRLESVAGRDHPQWESSTHRLSIGVEGIDRMLGGGLIKGSTTAIFGTPGIGKTLLNLQFLGAGGMAGETGLHVTFQETEDALLSTSNRLGLSYGECLNSGCLTVKWQPSLEQSPDGWAWSVLEAVDELRPSRLTIDAFTDVARMFAVPQRQTGFGIAFSNELRNRGVTTLVNLELDSLVSQTVDIPVPRISPMIDSGILMRSVELDSSLRRMVSIVKHRQSWFDSTIREFTIGQGGITIGERFDASKLLTGSADPEGCR
ncbi:MAG TPA: ATPase domain-containing protein [Thermomicrobiales bacterium]|nr:ATPase domain-containing protein [Thermomicrobiales bacterium]